MNLEFFLEKNFPDKFGPVLSQIARIPEFSLIHDLGILEMTTYDDPSWPQCLPDVRIRFFWPTSGFLKTSFLRSTHYEKFFDEKIFPDKICPGSGFALKRPVLQILFNPTFRY